MKVTLGKDMPYSNLGSFRRAVRQENKPDSIMQYRKRKIDATQYERWTNILGKENMPQSLEKFQDMKYNNIDKFIKLETLKKDQQIKIDIQSSKYNLAVDKGKQGKHILGHNNYIEGKSYLIIEESQLNKIVETFAGKGLLIRDRNGNWSNVEIVETGIEIGVSINNLTGKQSMTTKIKIHYSKNGIHVVPYGGDSNG